jgi:hypothetical protein
MRGKVDPQQAQSQLHTPESQRVFHKLSAGLRLKPGQGSGRSTPTNARWGCFAEQIPIAHAETFAQNLG